MIPTNHKNISLCQDARASLSSLVQQTAFIFVSFGVMLLLTGGNPSSFALTLTFSSGIAFVAWSEQRRLIKLRSQNETYFISDVERLAKELERLSKELAQQRTRDAEEQERLAKEQAQQRVRELEDYLRSQGLNPDSF